MASSSTEVMDSNEIQMVLVEAGESQSKDSEMDVSNDASVMETDMELHIPQSESFDPRPGSIIFSPQDMMTNAPVKTGRRGRGRGRGKAIKKPDALTIKIEAGGDYSRINVPVACELCGKLVANGKILVQHMATHSDVKPYQCPHCPKSFVRMVHLQGHLVLHGIEKQFECPVCHQRFSRQDCVKIHMRLHDKSKCVFCEICHKAFLTLGALNIHMRIHRGEKPFKCHLCGKCFTQKNHVITHIKRHTKVASAPFVKKLGPRMFQCEHCPRSFIRLSDYERHVQWNHGAVADTNKVIENINLDLEEQELNNDFATPRLSTLEETVKRAKPPKKRSSKKISTCTIGTQTDQEGGHVIIPRQYQTTTTMTTTSTQVSAPPTPRPTDDELYENEFFDEGMDRNFSSDEDEEESTIINDANLETTGTGTTMTYQEGETSMPVIPEGPSTSTNDDAFDAVLGKPKQEPVRCEEKQINDQEQLKESLDKGIEKEESELSVQLELASEYAKRGEGLLTGEPVNEDDPESPENMEVAEQPAEEPPQPVEPRSTVSVPQSVPQNSNTIQQRPNQPQQLRTTKIVENFNTKNWKGFRRARGRGRGRGRVKGVMGLTGATHLRLIRKSMINFISEKTEQVRSSGKHNEEDQYSNEEQDEPDKEQFADAEGIVKSKRQAKAKQHGKDFVCDAKSCEICNPVKNTDPLPMKMKESAIEVTEAPEVQVTDSLKTRAAGTVKDQSQKLLQFLISGDASNLQGTDFKLISDVGNMEKMKVNDLTANEYPADTSTSNNVNKAEFISSINSEEYVSPPVELQQFCIPTYSCKLCGREFRFEGKLHRHIESVHQKKAIFSPDVKPGRGAPKEIEDFSLMFETADEEPGEVFNKVVIQNPEIEALRSEWDDDDDGTNDEEMGSEDASVEAQSTVTPSAVKMPSIPPRPIVTKEITPVTYSVNDVYASGVKVNINKISGLAGSDLLNPGISKKKYRYSVQPPNQQEASKPQDKVSTLDTKCKRLLEKLFDHTLLINCGLFIEHVSVVLGRILQHYGVKMIEDYGQGQYEVLKYNLWRLIEWKVTMEQMEEFYTEGKSVEEMMDDIMNGRVPIIAHHEPREEQTQEETDTQQQQPEQHVEQIQTVEAIQISDNQLMLSQVANVLSGQLNLGDGVTQVVLAQDVSPEMLQGAHIVTIDPATGQVLSQVTAEQVILTDTLGEDLNQQVIDGQVVSHPSSVSNVVTTLPPGSIVASHSTSGQQVVTTSISETVMTNAHDSVIKVETTTTPHSTQPSQ